MARSVPAAWSSPEFAAIEYCDGHRLHRNIYREPCNRVAKPGPGDRGSPGASQTLDGRTAAAVRSGHFAGGDRRGRHGRSGCGLLGDCKCFDGIPVLPVNPDAETVADEIVGRSMMPRSARIDALHVATAALAGVQYLLTQNCKHIANARELPRIYRLLDELGLSGMLICTPIEFLGGDDNDT